MASTYELVVLKFVDRACGGDKIRMIDDFDTVVSIVYQSAVVKKIQNFILGRFLQIMSNNTR